MLPGYSNTNTQPMRIHIRLYEPGTPKGGVRREVFQMNIDNPDSTPFRPTMNHMLLSRVDTSLEHLKVMVLGNAVSDLGTQLSFSDHLIARESTLFVLPRGFHPRDSCLGAVCGMCCDLDD